MARVFISYKRKNKDQVFPIVDYIEGELGVKCWVDLDGIESSAQFASVICKAIDSADVILFMHSSVHLNINYETDWTIKELNYAQAKKKRIVLVKLDSSPLDNIFLMEYGTKNNIDSRDSVQLQKLISDLRNWLALPNAVNNNSKNEDIKVKSGSTDGNVVKLNKQKTSTSLNENYFQSPAEKGENTSDSNSTAHVKPCIQKSTVESLINSKTKSSTKTRNEGMTTPTTPNSINSSQGEIEEWGKKIYRQLGISGKAKEKESKTRENSNWWKFFCFFFDFSKESIRNYLITFMSLVALIFLMYFYGYFDNHPFEISEILVTLLISYVGMRCVLNLGIATDDSEEITNLLKGIIFIPFIVLFSPFFSILIGSILWWLSYHIFNVTLFHFAGVIYLYFSTACFTLFSLIYNLHKRKKNIQGN